MESISTWLEKLYSNLEVSIFSVFTTFTLTTGRWVGPDSVQLVYTPVRLSIGTFYYSGIYISCYQVQDMDESSADKSGKPFTAVPNSSHFFVVVGRNVDQWRASLGLEEGTNFAKQ